MGVELFTGRKRRRRKSTPARTDRRRLAASRAATFPAWSIESALTVSQTLVLAQRTESDGPLSTNRYRR